MSSPPTQLDPSWMSTAARARREADNIHRFAQNNGGQNPLVVTPPPEELSGELVSMHRYYGRGEATAGAWVVWCARGPVLLTRGESGKWTARAERFLCDRFHPSEEFLLDRALGSYTRELNEWIASWHPPHGFRSRAELLTVLRETLRREQAGEPLQLRSPHKHPGARG